MADPGRCECRHVASNHTLPSNHPRAAFKSAAGLTPCCIVRDQGLDYSPGSLATGHMVAIRFHGAGLTGGSIIVPASQLQLA